MEEDFLADIHNLIEGVEEVIEKTTTEIDDLQEEQDNFGAEYNNWEDAKAKAEGADEEFNDLEPYDPCNDEVIKRLTNFRDKLNACLAPMNAAKAVVES